MSRMTTALAALCLLTLGLTPRADAQFPQPQPLPANPKAGEAARALQQLLQDIRDVKDLLQRVNDTQTRRRLERLVDRMELNARRLADGLPLDPLFPTPEPMAKQDFARLLQSVKAKNINTDRLQVLAVADGAFFTSDQAKSLVKAFDFRGDAQRQAAIWLYPRLVDRPNFNTVLEAIPFPTERQAVLRALGISK